MSDIAKMRKEMELPPTPDGIPIGQQPTKPCEHDFLFLRSEVPDETEIAHVDAYTDVFYCRRCLEYREVKR